LRGLEPPAIFLRQIPDPGSMRESNAASSITGRHTEHTIAANAIWRTGY